MLRILKLSAIASALVVAVAMQASAATIIDPIVRTKLGGGSIGIPPLGFPFGSFPSDPDGLGSNCFVDEEIDPMGILVSCAFQNQTGQTIGFLDFDFDIPGNPVLVFDAQDVAGFFASADADFFGAQFVGGPGAPGIPSCNFDGEFCFGGEFIVELVGFPQGTLIDMTAAATAVPEPATLTLLATGIGMVVARRRRRQQ